MQVNTKSCPVPRPNFLFFVKFWAREIMATTVLYNTVCLELNLGGSKEEIFLFFFFNLKVLGQTLT